MTDSTTSPPLLTDQISQLAYDIYLKEGSPSDRAINHWTRAESILKPRQAAASFLSVNYKNGELWLGLKLRELTNCNEDEIEHLKEIMLQIVDDLPQPHMVVDLKLVQYLCSTMLGILAYLYRKVKQKSGRLSLAHATPQLQEEIHLFGLDRLIEVTS